LRTFEKQSDAKTGTTCTHKIVNASVKNNLLN
jgi:hypothetical protein